MNRKILAISFVLMMCLTSVVFITEQSEDVSADERTGKIHPYDRYNSCINCSGTSIRYEGVYSYEFAKTYYYYTSDPTEIVEKYINGETDNLGNYIAYDDLVNGIYYWAVYGGYKNSGSTSWDWKSYQLRMETIYLPAGTYEIEFTSTTMDNTVCRLRDFTETHYFNEFKNGNGKIKVPLTEAGSFYVYASSSSSGPSEGPANSALWSMEYKISPAPPEQKIVECEKSISVGTDKKWVCLESVTSLDEGIYRSMYGSGYYFFVRGSTEESVFLTNYVNKGIICPDPSPENFTLTSTSYIDMYKVSDSDSSNDERRSTYGFEKKAGMYEPTEYVYVEFNPKKLVDNETHYSFYAGQKYSIAVDFDPSQYSYVILKSGTMQVCMDPKKLYAITGESASEYEISAMMADGSTASMISADIKVYTEGVADPDNAGMTFAVVSIGFCAIAFFLLFYFGRRPKWDDLTGLPVSGTVETVVNEASEEVPETPAEETPPEQPPEE